MKTLNKLEALKWLKSHVFLDEETARWVNEQIHKLALLEKK